MDVRSVVVNITTSTEGAFSKNIRVPGPLFLHAVYAADANLSSAADLSIVDAYTNMPLLSVSNFGGTAQANYTPRRLINDADTGTESTSVYDYQAVNQTITVSVSGATAANQTGTLYLTFG